MIGDPSEYHESIEEDEESIMRTVGMRMVELPTRMRKEGGKLVIEISIPNVRADDINVLLKRDSLSVSADKRPKGEERYEEFVKAERMLRCYRVSETLPASIIPEKADVTYENGTLRIEAPLLVGGIK